MKKTTYLIAATTAALLMLFSACSKSEYRKSLTEADSIASINPQRAMAMLDSIKQEMADAPEHEQMYYKLLCIKAGLKGYIINTSDSAIIPVINYYETTGDKKLLPDVYYCAGRTYQNLNDAPQALEYFQKAIDVTPNNDIKMRSALYFHSGLLFINQALNDKALNMFLRAYKYDEEMHDTVNVIYSLKFLAYTYNKIGMMDSSIYYYQKAYELSQKINNNPIRMTVLAQMASFYIEKEDYVKAKECLAPSLKLYNSIDISPHYAMALKICMNTSQYDSAHFYAQELLKVGTVYAKQTASRYLTELALKEKNYNDADKYLKLFNEYTDSVKAITATESVNRMNSLYNYNLREKENLALKTENANRKFTLTIIISIVCILTMVVITYIYRNRQKQKIQTERLKRLNKELYRQSEEYIQQNKKKIDALEQELKRTSNENHQLIERIEEQRADLILANEAAMIKRNKNESSKARIAATDIYRTIHDHIKKEKVINDREWTILEETINREIDDFKDNLYGYHNISQQEFHICVLIRLDFSPKDMAVLLGCTTSAVSKIRKRLQEKFFSDSGTPKDFDRFIKTM